MQTSKLNVLIYNQQMNKNTMRYYEVYGLVLLFLKNLMHIKAPINVSNKLKGILYHSISVGNTPTFHTTIHIITNAINHDNRVV